MQTDTPDFLLHRTMWEVVLRNCLEKGRHFEKTLGVLLPPRTLIGCTTFGVDTNGWLDAWQDRFSHDLANPAALQGECLSSLRRNLTSFICVLVWRCVYAKIVIQCSFFSFLERAKSNIVRSSYVSGGAARTDSSVSKERKFSPLHSAHEQWFVMNPLMSLASLKRLMQWLTY